MRRQRQRFDRYITIETPAETSNEFGELESTWSTQAQVWAKKEDNPAGKSSKEDFSAARETAFLGTVWTIRYRSDITEKMRISHDSKTYDIISISEVGRNVYLEIKTELRQ